MSRATAIRIATQHALQGHPGIDLDAYTISAPARPDWFSEWNVYFHHKSQDASFLISVEGGDVYNGSRVRVMINNEWRKRP
jgi:hypothetical protein